ncbi:MBL fold metallo-hydrolase [Kiloniella laminariae]|uniref:MBL fold metallo-hydrolase n=1 Tax=Kiloniella laminariae TaxID=454162 RepID=A0ABT4LK91_9PROT|nr:MBL fold metallo-hydrolase [Kiloniella laminariae]MCZ4281527.1 MBL fold metallo-hydrolase [Kiloniella laminariae]
MTPQIEAFFHEASNTLSYLVWDPTSLKCAIIDSALDYAPSAGRTSTESAEAIVQKIRQKKLSCQWILETHVHADHISAAPFLKKTIGGTTAVGNQISAVQRTFKTIYNTEPAFQTNGEQFDHLFADHENFELGSIPCQVLHTPGHTPACITYIIGDCAFVGDTLFMPDFGTARADFPGGDAGALYDSIHKIFKLPDNTRLFTCHDYAPNGRKIAWETTVSEQKQHNLHIRSGITRDDFIKMRTERDKQLAMPALLIPSIQVNMRAGDLPPAEADGNHYLKVPLNRL